MSDDEGHCGARNATAQRMPNDHPATTCTARTQCQPSDRQYTQQSPRLLFERNMDPARYGTLRRSACHGQKQTTQSGAMQNVRQAVHEQRALRARHVELRLGETEKTSATSGSSTIDEHTVQ
ncbi:hypothetical protein CERZMDRAFT_90783 [Cercospora zeae-maydis SCOH1-5]|uniref:Uncharacterized protein n=1 Tax=Cercospora zeae-maydis SCOH1-5 TaxID=717836 RepID=A0A6A6FER4_9PEZI|nr:hypothetical protein CERZMDRAFT_90783 [Cercospora zeae-maydis SCOH1-5]